MAPSRRNQRKRRGRSGGGHLTAAGPNAVAEALGAGIQVDHVFLEQGAPARASKVAEEARRAGIPVSSTGKGECDRIAGVRCQGIAAEIRYGYSEFSDLLDSGDGLIVFLDEIQDPHNLGAILRTAEAAGALGVVITARRGAQLNSTSLRVSAGAALHLRLCRVNNLVRALEQAKEAGFWVIGLDHEASKQLAPPEGQARLALVVGGEGEGMRSLVQKSCDELAKLPMKGRVGSLNASVAAGVAIYRLAAGPPEAP